MTRKRMRMIDGSVVSLSVTSLLLAVLMILGFPFHSPAMGEPDEVLGALSAVGSVRLRGIPIFREGTLFAGDRIETVGPAYVSVRLTGGPQLELGDDTDVQVVGDASGIEVLMNSGHVVFSSPESSIPLSVSVRSFRIEAPRGAEVEFLSSNRLSVRALGEIVTVTELIGQDSETVPPGDDPLIIDLDAVVDSPQNSAATGGSGPDSGPSTAKWVLIGAGAGGAVGTVILLTGGDKETASQSQP